MLIQSLQNEYMGLTDEDRKYCFNVMAGYCDTDGVFTDSMPSANISCIFCVRVFLPALEVPLYAEEIL